MTTVIVGVLIVAAVLVLSTAIVEKMK